ncbi:hypothetical protein H2200_007914 [Cladophialophora chaetospira]|uniref:Uncharacterized protein n=1 Tax=Cladophialophora chaetospira TaxID=386627 RepID=A0AA38X6N7_9EURO|nr:hypothetical protein H2200_007914 [Cladophialophora chaetospira]
MHKLLFLYFIATSSILTSANAIDVDLSKNNGESILVKRQNYTCSSAGLEEICQNDTAECISDMCASCSGYVLIAQCCALSTYSLMMQCLLNLYNNPVDLTATVAPSSTKSADSSTITQSPNLTNSSLGGLGACVSLDAALLACEDQTPGFSTEPFTAKASCLCYSGGTFQPDLYDGMYSTCLAYLSTAEPSDYSSLTAGHKIHWLLDTNPIYDSPEPNYGIFVSVGGFNCHTIGDWQ